MKVAQANEFISAYVDWANAVGQRLAKVECDDPWIVAGWAKVRGVLAIVRRMQKAHSLCKTTKEVIALVDRLISREKIDLLGSLQKDCR